MPYVAEKPLPVIVAVVGGKKLYTGFGETTKPLTLPATMTPSI
jgi:hypothetical protein